MEVEIQPEPSESERRAIYEALCAEARAAPQPYRSRWREAALADLRRDSSPEDAGGDSRVVET